MQLIFNDPKFKKEYRVKWEEKKDEGGRFYLLYINNNETPLKYYLQELKKVYSREKNQLKEHFATSALRGFDLHLVQKEVVQEFSSSSVVQNEIKNITKIYSPMPGKIFKFLVNEQDEVKENQSLVILEAMKMEHSILSPKNGKIKKIWVKVGEIVPNEHLIIELYD